MYLVKADLFK